MARRTTRQERPQGASDDQGRGSGPPPSDRPPTGDPESKQAKAGRAGRGVPRPGSGPPGNRHGAGHGAPKGNRNAVKHGIWGRLVSDDLVDEALALAELAPDDRARMHRLLREARVLRAARDASTPLQALDRGWASILADLDPEAQARGGDEDQRVLVVPADSDDWRDLVGDDDDA